MVGMRRMSKLGWSFVSQDAGGELVMTLDCPEFARGGEGRRGGVKALPMHRGRSPRPGGQGSAPVLRSRATAEGGLHPLRRRVSAVDGGLARLRWMPEWRCSFILHDAGDEWVMRLKCPVFRGGASGGRAACRLGSRRNSRFGNLRYAWRNTVRSVGGKAPPRSKTPSCTQLKNSGISRIDFLVFNGSVLN